MKELIEKLLEEVDSDIKEMMLREDKEGYYYWQLLTDPANTILNWQSLRTKKNE